MQKLFFLCGIFSAPLFFAQELTPQMKGMLQYDNTDEFSTFIKKEDINKCFQVKESKYSLLVLAIKLDSKKMFEKLIDEKADLNLVCDNKTPLMYTAKYGKTDFAKMLLEKGADKSLKTEDGMNAFDYAMKYEKPKLAEILK